MAKKPLDFRQYKSRFITFWLIKHVGFILAATGFTVLLIRYGSYSDKDAAVNAARADEPWLILGLFGLAIFFGMRRAIEKLLEAYDKQVEAFYKTVDLQAFNNQPNTPQQVMDMRDQSDFINTLRFLGWLRFGGRLIGYTTALIVVVSITVLLVTQNGSGWYIGICVFLTLVVIFRLWITFFERPRPNANPAKQGV